MEYLRFGPEVMRLWMGERKYKLKGGRPYGQEKGKE